MTQTVKLSLHWFSYSELFYFAYAEKKQTSHIHFNENLTKKKIQHRQLRPHHAHDGLTRTFHKTFLHMARRTDFCWCGRSLDSPHSRYLIYYNYTLIIENNCNNRRFCQFSNVRWSPTPQQRTSPSQSTVQFTWWVKLAMLSVSNAAGKTSSNEVRVCHVATPRTPAYCNTSTLNHML